MRKGLHACGREDRNRLREELQTAKKEYCQHFEALQKSIEGCRSQAVAELARAQIACSREMESLLKDGRLERYLHSEKSSPAEDQAEAVTLYAEYAIDYAIQSMLYALVAALFAADLQMSTEEQKGVSESCRK